MTDFTRSRFTRAECLELEALRLVLPPCLKLLLNDEDDLDGLGLDSRDRQTRFSGTSTLAQWLPGWIIGQEAARGR